MFDNPAAHGHEPEWFLNSSGRLQSDELVSVATEALAVHDGFCRAEITGVIYSINS